MKTLKTLLPLLALFILLNTETCQSLSSANVASAVTNVITGKYEFNDTLWKSLDSGDTLAYMKGYLISLELLRTREDMMQVLKNSINIKELSHHLINFEERVLKIDLLYTSLVDQRQQTSDDKMRDECWTVLKNETIWNLLEPARKIRNLLNAEITNIYHKLNGEIDAYTRTCSTQETQHSVQSMFYKYLTLLVAAEVKIFSTLNIARQILSEQIDVDTYVLDGMYLARVKYLTNEHRKMVSVFKPLMQSTSSNIWRCEPDKYIEDESYIKLKHVFQGFLRRQVDTKRSEVHKYEDTCDLDTPDLCPRRCGGPLWDCKHTRTVGVSRYVTVCYSEAQSDRTYEYVQKVDWQLIGSTQYTTDGLKGTACKAPKRKVDIDRGIKGGPFGLEFNLYYCTCDDQLDHKKTGIVSDRKFYTGAVMANFKDNYVVTGARLRKAKENGVIYIQIQTGKLLPGGNVDNSSVEWQEIPKYRLEDPSYHYELRWEDRAIEVQDVEIPDGHVLIGIRFKHVVENGVKRLRLEADHESFEFTTGKYILKEGSTIYDSTPERTSNLEHIDVKEQNVPETTALNNIAVSNIALSFSTSNFHNDYGQTTIPFIDIQDVSTRVSFPLSGIGLFYRKSQDINYAGFLSLKLKTYDFSKHLPIY